MLVGVFSLNYHHYHYHYHHHVLDDLPPISCPEIHIEENILMNVFTSLCKEQDRTNVLESLQTLQQCFILNYHQITTAFNNLNGVQMLERVIVHFTEDIKVVETILETLFLAVSKTPVIPQLDQNNIIGLCVQVLIRCGDEKQLVKLSLKIIRALCMYRT